MTSSHHVHLTCLLGFPVYRYLYPPPHVNSNDFTRHQKEDVQESQKKCKQSGVFFHFPRDDIPFIAFTQWFEAWAVRNCTDCSCLSELQK